MIIKQLVVGIDGSSAGAQALDWAAAEADRKGIDLVIAHATDAVTPAGVSSAPVLTVMMESAEYGLELLAAASALTAKNHPAVNVHTVLRTMRPADLLIELGTPETILVVGSRGFSRFVGALVGSVSHRVASQAHCPVVVVPHEKSTASEVPRIVVGVLAPSAGHHTLRLGFQEAAERNARLLAVCAYGTFGRPVRGALLQRPADDKQHEEQELRDTLAALQEEYPTVHAEARLVDGPIDGTLCTAALNAEMLIVDCRHDDGHRSSRLGPEVSRLLHNSPCPIVVVGSAHIPVTVTQ